MKKESRKISNKMILDFCRKEGLNLKQFSEAMGQAVGLDRDLLSTDFQGIDGEGRLIFNHLKCKLQNSDGYFFDDNPRIIVSDVFGNTKTYEIIWFEENQASAVEVVEERNDGNNPISDFSHA
jgi:hypothetical protein